jgi:hypothetical protein
MATNGIYYNQTNGLSLSTDSLKRVIISTGGTSTFTGYTSGSTIVDVAGTQGELFEVNDDMSGDILAVTDTVGNTIFAVNTYDPIRMIGLTANTSTNFLVVDNTGRIGYNVSGMQGVSGLSGLQGTAGSNGESGISGLESVSGISGRSGISGVAGANGISSSIFYYSANTLSTSGNPGTGYTLWNNATQTASTQLNIHHLTNTLVDIDVFLATIAPGQKYIIQDVLDSGNYQIWNVTGTTTNINPNTSTSYWTIPVSISSSLGNGSTNFSNNQQLFIAIQGGTSGISGQSGVSGNVGGGISWVNALTTQSMVANTGYVTTASTLTTLTLPTTISLGQTLEVVGYGTGLWRLNENSNQFIKFGNTGTTTTSGILSATSAGDSVRMTCVSANTAFVITSSIGNVFFS